MRFLLILLLGLTQWVSAASVTSARTPNAHLFAKPDALKPAVEFWKKVYTEADTQSGYIHDNRRLDIIYETVGWPEDYTRKQRRRYINQQKEIYVDALKALAQGKRKRLNSVESRVLKLWGEKTSRKTFKAAAERVRFQLGQSDRFRAGLERSTRWMPYIEKTFLEMDLPIELTVLPHVESSFNPGVYSHVGAAGMWQFTRSTGRRFMQVDHIVDARLDPYQATQAAAQLLAHNHSIVETWPLALTAYNHGVAGMRRAVKKIGSTDMAKIVSDYQGRTFGFASRNFYTAFLAALEITDEPDAYFNNLDYAAYQTYNRVEMPAYTTISTLTRQLNIDAQTLKDLNPGLLTPVWEQRKYIPAGYPLRLPVNDQDYALSIANIETRYWFADQRPDAKYRVRKGDTLSRIAAWYKTSTRELMTLNNLRSKNRIRIGQVLTLPGAAQARLAEQRTQLDDAGYYRVVKGDSLAAIAKRFDMSAKAIVDLNQLNNPNDIKVGQRLRLSPYSQTTRQLATAVSQIQTRSTKPVQTATAGQSVQSASTAEPVTQQATALNLANNTEVVDAQDAQALQDLAAETVAALESEPATATEAQIIAPVQPAGLHPALAADPRHFGIRGSNIVVHEPETLGHYADWLQVRTQRLRQLNKMSYGQALVRGQTIKLDLSQVDKGVFEARRLAFHQQLQDNYFKLYQINGTTEYKVNQGESIWRLAQRFTHVPMWLFLQYNPDLDLNRLTAGTVVTVPLVTEKTDA